MFLPAMITSISTTDKTINPKTLKMVCIFLNYLNFTYNKVDDKYQNIKEHKNEHYKKHVNSLRKIIFITEIL